MLCCFGYFEFQYSEKGASLLLKKHIKSENNRMCWCMFYLLIIQQQKIIKILISMLASSADASRTCTTHYLQKVSKKCPVPLTSFHLSIKAALRWHKYVKCWKKGCTRGKHKIKIGLLFIAQFFHHLTKLCHHTAMQLSIFRFFNNFQQYAIC